MDLKDKIINCLHLGESKFIEEIEKDKNLSYEKRNMENIEIIAVYDEREESKLIEEFEFDENENYVGDIKINVEKSLEFKLFDKLSLEQRIHLADFNIISSIENATDKDFSQREKEILFEVIKCAWLKDETNISVSTIADAIVEAYANDEVGLEALENASSFEVLDCAIGMGSFEDMQDEWEDLEE